MGGKKVPCPRDGQRHFERLPGFFHETPGAFQHNESRMSLVQVTDFRLDAKRIEQPPPADSQDDFLL